MRHIKLAVVLVLLMIVTTACVQVSKGGGDNQPSSDTTQGIQTINLSYAPVSTNRLEEGQPGENLVMGKSMYIGVVPKQIEATIYLYVEVGSEGGETNTGTAYGFLEYEGKLYEIGEVGNYGLDSVRIDLFDKTYDGIKDIVITGPKGAAYEEMNIISYNQENKEWMNILTMGSPQIVDLDDDGVEELVAVSAGSLPSYVDFYRWGQNRFEKASVTEATGKDYAQLYNKNGQWIIESGKLGNGKAETIQYYRYDNGKLIDISSAK